MPDSAPVALCCACSARPTTHRLDDQSVCRECARYMLEGVTVETQDHKDEFRVLAAIFDNPGCDWLAIRTELWRQCGIGIRRAHEALSRLRRANAIERVPGELGSFRPTYLSTGSRFPASVARATRVAA